MTSRGSKLPSPKSCLSRSDLSTQTKRHSTNCQCAFVQLMAPRVGCQSSHKRLVVFPSPIFAVRQSTGETCRTSMPCNSSMFSIPRMIIRSQASSKVRRQSYIISESSNRPAETILLFARPGHVSCAERRRNVALVRREGPIKRGLLCVAKFLRCSATDF